MTGFWWLLFAILISVWGFSYSTIVVLHVAVFYEFSKPLWLLVCCVCFYMFLRLLIASMLGTWIFMYQSSLFLVTQGFVFEGRGNI